jgi:hypothetical protein
MNMRAILLLLALVPFLAVAQGPASRSATEGPNAATRAVLLANCPRDMPPADWLKLMSDPVNASLYPIRLSQAMLDTMDATQLDPRYQYVLVPDEAAHHGNDQH